MKILRKKKIIAALLAAAVLLIGLLAAAAVSRAHSTPQYLHIVPGPTPSDGVYMIPPKHEGCVYKKPAPCWTA